jgi:hypothetical protein
MQNIPRRSWTEQSKRQEELPFPFVKCCGATTQSEKQLGRRKLISKGVPSLVYGAGRGLSLEEEILGGGGECNNPGI